MPRKPKGLNKPIAKTAARMSRKAALTPAQLEKLRVECMEELRRINGCFDFESAVQWQQKE